MQLEDGDAGSPLNNKENLPRYLDELMRDMRLMNQIQLAKPDMFRRAAMLLTEEIDRVWSAISSYQKEEKGAGEAPITPRVSNKKLYKEQPRMPAYFDRTPTTLQEKILIPSAPSKSTKCNFIGRILGPCGISVKHLERETDCHILIRGEGSVKDTEREGRLIGKPGWEHLSEPLHVLVTAKDYGRESCESKLARAVEMVKALLTPQHDDYKKKQLVQLAIINGTFRPEPRSSKK